MLVTISSRPGRKVFMHKKEFDAMESRTGEVHFFGAITKDYKMTEPTPQEILFGPHHNSLPPHAPASWSPSNHREYYKKYG